MRSVRRALSGAWLAAWLVAAAGLSSGTSLAQDLAPPPGYDHARYVTLPPDRPSETNPTPDIVRVFPAYISVFDGHDDDDGNGTGDVLGIPEYVTYHLRRYEGVLPAGPARPSWATDRALRREGLISTDATYRYSQAFRRAHPNWYVRGHLCMKQHAWRISALADRTTHTMLNAVPQREEMNSGIWLSLENLNAQWADLYGEVWIITGPIFYQHDFDHANPARWLGEAHKGETLIAIPDALFKIIVREDGDGIAALAFIYDQDIPRQTGAYDHLPHLASIDEIEQLTGHDFLAILADDVEVPLESETADALWPTSAP